mgnify:CR=1 FL=1
MNTNNLNTALYEKMATEQEKYRDWLKSQPPEEILHHTYEYDLQGHGSRLEVNLPCPSFYFAVSMICTS